MDIYTIQYDGIRLYRHTIQMYRCITTHKDKHTTIRSYGVCEKSPICRQSKQIHN